MDGEGRTLSSGGGRKSFLQSGFAVTLALRLLTSSLAIVVPLFAIEALGESPAGAGTLVFLLWVGNALGVGTAVLAVRDQTASSVAGFAVLGGAMWLLSAGAWVPTAAAVILAGVGMGLPQPFLSGFMHLDSRPEMPFSGLGVYSTALGLGLVLGPLVSYAVFGAGGFGAVFVALALVSAVGLVAGAVGRGRLSRHARPPLPSPVKWLRSVRSGTFGRAVAVNFLYSLLLPLFLSYGAIFAERRFGFSTTDALLLFTAVFVVSVAARGAAVRASRGLGRLLVASVALLLLSSLLLGLAPNWWVFVLGMFVFSIPHAFVYPLTSYFAFNAASEGDVMNASYALQGSSGTAELISPAVAVGVVVIVGVQTLFLWGAVLAALALVAATFRSPWTRD